MPLYDFVRTHVIPFNAVIAMAIAVAAVLDFLAPRAPYLAWLSYALAALVLVAMALEVRFQSRSHPENAWYLPILNRLRAPPGPLWKAPAWQVVAVIAIAALGLGQASKVRAGSGGLIASAAPNLRNVQALLLGLQEDTRRIQTTLDGVGATVESIHTSVGGIEEMLGADDPLSALSRGDFPFLKKYVAGGGKLPVDLIRLVQGLSEKRPDRFDLLALYMQKGPDLGEPESLYFLNFGGITNDFTVKRNVKRLNAWATKNHDVDDSIGLLFVCKQMTLLDYAYISEDR